MISQAVILVLVYALISPGSAIESTYIPYHVKYADLAASNSETMGHMLQTLQHVGIVAISEIPSFSELRVELLTAGYECAQLSPTVKTSALKGNIEMTSFAATPKTAFSAQESSSKCVAFEKHFSAYRERVSGVSQLFSRQLGSALNISSPLLISEDERNTYEDIEAIVQDGSHLDHLHVYKHAPQQLNLRPRHTIDYHTDQGMFIAFSPALILNATGSAAVARDFWIELKDRSTVPVDFSTDPSVLVFMLGDGVNQYVNPKITTQHKLRPTPHALDLHLSGSSTRVWFGRMFLPPTDAISEAHRGMTFGRLREITIAKSLSSEDHSEGGTVGCSGNLISRELSSDSCGEDQLFCWMRCMDPTERASPSICASQDLAYKCASQYDQIWDSTRDSHGDYNPTCTNSVAAVTEVPTLDPTPDSCQEEDWEGFLDEGEYSGKGTFMDGQLVFLWKLVDGFVEAKLAFNGQAGWLSVGLQGPPCTSHPGMNDASIVMGLVEPEKFTEVGTSVHEYRIADESAFRHWNTPLDPVTFMDAEIVDTDCFVSIAFKTQDIGGSPLNMAARNKMIWGVHTTTAHIGYHGYRSRGHFAVDFREDVITEATMPVGTCNDSNDAHGDHDDHNDHGNHGDNHKDDMSYAGSLDVQWLWLAVVALSQWMLQP